MGNEKFGTVGSLGGWGGWGLLFLFHQNLGQHQSVLAGRYHCICMVYVARKRGSSLALQEITCGHVQPSFSGAEQSQRWYAHMSATTVD